MAANKNPLLKNDWPKRLRQLQNYAAYVGIKDTHRTKITEKHLALAAELAPLREAPAGEDKWEPNWKHLRNSFQTFYSKLVAKVEEYEEWKSKARSDHRYRV